MPSAPMAASKSLLANFLVNLRSRFQRREENVRGVGISVDRRVTGPVCAGDLLVGGKDHLHAVIPFLVVSRLDLVAPDFAIAHVRDVHRGTQTISRAEAEHTAVGIAQQFTISGPGTGQVSRQGGVFLLRTYILLPRFK